MADGNDHLYAPGRNSMKHELSQIADRLMAEDADQAITIPRNALEEGKYQIHRDVRILDGMDDIQEYVTLHVCQKPSCSAVATFLAYNTRTDLYACKEHLADAMAHQTDAFNIMPSQWGFVAGGDHRG